MSGEPESSQSLMLAYRDGDINAFEVLYQRHRASLYRYFLRQCGSPQVAEELYQDVWMKLIRARERYQPTAKFTTYLFHLAHNRLIDHYRRQSGEIPVSFGSEGDPDAVPASESHNPERNASGREQMNRLLLAIDTLPEAQREAFLLKEEAGLSLEELAQVTSVNRETAKSRLRYAVSKLREALTDEDS
jgi:RNA polymerase sigma-70 factor (ECF subfamily)